MTSKQAKIDAIRTMEMALGAALALVRPEAHLSWKDMFGGAGFYADGVIFAAWFGAGLALKLPEDKCADLLQIQGAAKPWAKHYVEVPPAFLDDPILFAPWVEISVAYVTTPKQHKR